MAKPWQKSARIESLYQRQVKAIGREVGRIISGYDTTTEAGRTAMTEALSSYKSMLEPWAKVTAEKYFSQLNNQDIMLWHRNSIKIGRGIIKVIDDTPVGDLLKEFINRQVDLITSLPTDAGLRVHTLAREAWMGGRRPESITQEIMNSGTVTANRAKLIARTEMSRMSSVLTQTRAINIGATHYTWQTVKDAAVRSSHRHMQGVVCSLHEPPEVEPGKFYHPGEFPNCRCHPAILIPGIDE